MLKTTPQIGVPSVFPSNIPEKFTLPETIPSNIPEQFTLPETIPSNIPQTFTLPETIPSNVTKISIHPVFLHNGHPFPPQLKHETSTS